MQGHPVTLLCQYERTDWSTSELTELCEMHSIEVATPAIYDDGLLRITRHAPFSTRVSGEKVRGVLYRTYCWDCDRADLRSRVLKAVLDAAKIPYDHGKVP